MLAAAILLLIQLLLPLLQLLALRSVSLFNNPIVVAWPGGLGKVGAIGRLVD